MRWTLFAMLTLGFLAYTTTMVVGVWLNPDRAPSRYRGRSVRSVAPLKPARPATPLALAAPETTRPIERSAMLDTSVHN